VGTPGCRVEPAHGRLGDGRPVLDGGEESRQRASIARDRGIGQLVGPRRGVGH
jgi:hypothetical protein